MDTTGPNAQQIQYWNETAGPKWVTLQAELAQAMKRARDAELLAARSAARNPPESLRVHCNIRRSAGLQACQTRQP